MSDTNPNKLKGGKNAATMSKNALERRQERRANRGNGAVADWSIVDSEIVQNLIATVTGQKGTITLGYTRDGSTYYISYYFGDESEAVYCRPTEDIDRFLQAEIEAFAI